MIDIEIEDDAWAEAIIRDAVACYAGEDGKWGLREWRCFCRDARLEEPTPAPELIWLTLYDRAATSGGGCALPSSAAAARRVPTAALR